MGCTHLVNLDYTAVAIFRFSRLQGQSAGTVHFMSASLYKYINYGGRLQIHGNTVVHSRDTGILPM